MNKSIIVFSLLLLGVWHQSQQVAVSPYSGIGIGEPKFDQNVILNGMAGTSTTASSQFGNEANFFNAAANKNMIFTSFGATMSTDLMKFKTDNGLDSDRSNTYLSDIFVAFPISKKTKFGLGFQPFTAVGYKTQRTYDETDPVKVIQFEGDGGLNNIQSFVSYNVDDNWSVGLRANYLFGNISKIQTVGVKDANLNSEYNNYTKMNGLMAAPGFFYSKNYAENKWFNIGGTYTFQTNLKTRLDYLQSTFYYDQQGRKTNVDTVSNYRGAAKTSIGQGFSLGLSLEKSLKYRLALEGEFNAKPVYDFEYNFYKLNNSYRLAFGGWYIPNINSYKSYFDKMVYRFGAYYTKGNVNINSHDIDQFGITFGLGLPVGKKGRRDPSMLNLSVDLGSRGTTSDGLIRENFANLKIGLNFNDVWFRRKKYD